MLLAGHVMSVFPLFPLLPAQVTILTNPVDLAAGHRATVVCGSATGANPCIRTGSGLYGGAAAINLTNFDVVMTGSASGSCIHLNEGAGSGVSAYWAFYLAARGLSPTLSYIQVRTWRVYPWLDLSALRRTGSFC
jgi:hypothetical protein